MEPSSNSIPPDAERIAEWLMKTPFPNFTRLPKSQMNGVRIRTSSSFRPNSSSRYPT